MGKLTDFLLLCQGAFGRFASTPIVAVSSADDDAVVDLRGDADGALRVSAVTSIPTIDPAHRHIHDGDYYTVANVSSQLDTASYYWRIVVPAGVRPHFVLDATCNVAADFAIYESPTVNAGGTAVAALNSDRESDNVSAVRVYAGATSTADGTLLWSATGGGSGGAVRTREEILLRGGTTYFFKATTLAAGGFVHAHFAWYEAALA